MTDFAARRIMMVDTQVRPNDVTKFPIIEAMLAIPREQFVPASAREAAYVGGNIDLGLGRVMLEPRTLSKLLDALDVQPTDHVLVVGAGLGYSSAVIARMAASVVGVEDRADLMEAAGAHAGTAVTFAQTALANGSPASGPFDRIVIEGGVETVPAAILSQRRPLHNWPRCSIASKNTPRSSRPAARARGDRPGGRWPPPFSSPVWHRRIRPSGNGPDRATCCWGILSIADSSSLWPRLRRRRADARERGHQARGRCGRKSCAV